MQEYEKETTETVRGLFEEVEELFYKSEDQAPHPQSSAQACQDSKDCQRLKVFFDRSVSVISGENTSPTSD